MEEYKVFKDSGAEWIGKMPEEWQVNTIGALYTLRSEKVSDRDYPPLSVTMKGIVPQLSTAAKTDDHDSRKLVRKGDFAINSRSDRRGSCGISDYDGSVSLINTVLTPRGEMNPRYYNWLFHTVQFADEYYKNGHGIVDDLWTTRWDEMKRILIPIPPQEIQSKIADYLGRKIPQIDNMISEATSIINELKAYELSIISECVQSLDIPSISIRHFINSIEQGWSPPPAETVASENGWFVTTLSAVKRGVFNPMLCKPIDATAKIPENLELQNGDFLMTRSNTRELVGDVCMVEADVKHLIFSDLIYRISFSEKLLPQYAKFLLRSSLARQQIQSAAQGSSESMPKISHKVIKSLKFPIPCIAEQKRIVCHLDDVTSQINTLITEKESLISDLESYKKSLIYEVVTGKRKV